MRSFKLREVIKWGEKHGAEIEVDVDHYDREVVRVIFERYDQHPWNPKVYIETTKYCDPFRVEGVTTEIEEWDGPGQENYSKETVESTGAVGGESHVNMWGDELQVHEVGQDGYNRVMTIQV